MLAEWSARVAWFVIDHDPMSPGRWQVTHFARTSGAMSRAKDGSGSASMPSGLPRAFIVWTTTVFWAVNCSSAWARYGCSTVPAGVSQRSVAGPL